MHAWNVGDERFDAMAHGLAASVNGISIQTHASMPTSHGELYPHTSKPSFFVCEKRSSPVCRLVAKLNSTIEQYQSIVSRLFPSKDVEDLSSLSQEELLDLALSKSSQPVPTSTASLPGAALQYSTPRSPGVDSLECLEEVPEQCHKWDEARRDKSEVQSASDDVNGLSMSVRHSSYVGVSSISAALKVIMKALPAARPLPASTEPDTADSSFSNSPAPELEDEEEFPSPSEADFLIDAYFERVHVFCPLLDERKVRDIHRKGGRRDRSWTALINMVFALGSLSSGTCESDAHIVYYERARDHLNFETFGCGNIEVLQTLGMMGGYYMHYLNRPNEGSAIMGQYIPNFSSIPSTNVVSGAAFRMACSLGLHREYHNPALKDGAAAQSLAPSMSRLHSRILHPGMRRRIWWSLFCLDTWASITTGRPSLGRISVGVTVRELGNEMENEADPQALYDMKILPLIYNTKYCKISTEIQDYLAASALINAGDLNRLDEEVVQWYESLPAILTTDPKDTVPSFLHTCRLVMKWRTQNLRIILHRPYLLSTALRRAAFAELGPEERAAVGKCRSVASRAIEDISSDCSEDLISGWNGVWLCFQACFVPLVSLFSDNSNVQETTKWEAQVEQAIEFFERMRLWSVSARKSKDAVQTLYDVYKTMKAASTAVTTADAEFLSNSIVGEESQQPPHQQGFVDGYATNLLSTDLTMDIWPDENQLSDLSGFWDDITWGNFQELSDNQYGALSFDLFHGDAPC